ncbi:sensor domain-containing diguanylate cyclase [Aureimonas sp. AU4]|uniref:GGDEF domain-containing protein n=1 Tax=Aureimonas sp. AU4 TaxID=1638163 RepID=UPI000706D082|nr:sensor domain-containing diguanylate cyclase [Aureimonas sp. AU4]BAT30595.1 diguanylate cyclase with PAS/PAC sensor [Aureimonas sp. AU4]
MPKINVDSLAVPAFSVAIDDDGTVFFDGINAPLCALTRLTKEGFVGRRPSDVLASDGARDWEANYRRCIATGVMDEYEERVTTPSGTRWWRTILSPVINDAGKVVQLLGLTCNIDERKRTEEQLRSEAYSDPVTGIGNRRRFDLDLAAAMATSMDTGKPFALVLADIDRFKSINDAFGHEVGDEVLRETARRLRSGVRQGDRVARIGGDEFAAIVSAATPGAVALALDRIGRTFSGPVTSAGIVIPATISLGAALWDSSMTPKDLRRVADRAMYDQKVSRASQAA